MSYSGWSLQRRGWTAMLGDTKTVYEKLVISDQIQKSIIARKIHRWVAKQLEARGKQSWVIQQLCVHTKFVNYSSPVSTGIAPRRRKILRISESKVVLLEQIRPFRATFLDLKSPKFPACGGLLKKNQGLFLSGLFLFSDSGKSVGGILQDQQKKNLRPYKHEASSSRKPSPVTAPVLSYP